MSSFKLFRERLLEMSESDDWFDVIDEWKPIQYYHDEEPSPFCKVSSLINNPSQ